MPEFDPLRAKVDIDADDALRSMNGMIGAVGSFRAALGAGGAALVAFAGARGLASATKAAIEWERVLTNVAKTVDGTEIQIAGLGSEILKMSERIPLTSSELAELGEVAGQLGVQLENIPGLIETAAALGVATNLSAREAAESLARLSAVLGTSEEDFDRLGSSLVDLGNNSRTTERDILALAQRLAAAGRVIGLTEGEVLGFASALSSVGIGAEAGGTAFSKVFLEMQAAVQTGGAELRTFADLARLTVPEFAELFERDAGEAVALFVEGLGRLVETGGNTSRVLETLGFQEVRVRNALLSSAAAGDELRQSLERGNAAFDENNALAEEAARFYGTTESQTQLLKNQLTALQIQIGRDLLPTWRSLLGVAADFLDVIRDLNSTPLTLALPQGQASELDQAIEDLVKRTESSKAVEDLTKLRDTLREGGLFGGFARGLLGEEAGDLAVKFNVLGQAIALLADKAGDAEADDSVDRLAQQIFDGASKLEGELQETFIATATNIVKVAGSTEEASDRIQAALALLVPFQGLEPIEVKVDGPKPGEIEPINEAFQDLLEQIELNRIRLLEGDEAARRFELGIQGVTGAMADAVIAGERANEVIRQGLFDTDHIALARKQLEQMGNLIGGQLGQALKDAAADTDAWRSRALEVADAFGGPVKRAIQSIVTEQKLSLQTVRPLPNVAKQIREEWEKAARAAEEHRRQILDTARGIETAVRGALDLGQAFGAIGPELASTLTSVTNLGSSIVGITQSRKIDPETGLDLGFDLGGALPFIGGALGAAANLFGAVFGESASDRRIREAQEANTVAIERLKGSVDTLADVFDSLSGELVGVAADIAEKIVSIPRDFVSDSRLRSRGVLEDIVGPGLEGLGISVAEIEELARSLNVPVDQLLRFVAGVKLSGEEAAIAVDQWVSLQEATLLAADAANSFSAQWQRLRREFELFDITNPIEQLERTRQLFLDFVTLPDELERAIAGADLSTPEGRAAFQAALEQAFRLFGVDREFAGKLSRDAAEDLLVEMERAAEAITDAAESQADGGGSDGFRSVRTITEVGANLMIAVLTTIAITLDQIKAVEEAQLVALGGTIPQTAGGQLPPGFGGGGVGFDFNQLVTLETDMAASLQRLVALAEAAAPAAGLSITVNVGPGASPGTAQAVHDAVLLAIPEIDRALGERRDRSLFFSGAPRTIN